MARLPSEIRLVIWEYALGRKDDRDVLHLELADGTLRHNRCYERDEDLLGFKHDCWRAAWRMSFRRSGARGKKEPAGNHHAVLPLLFTCKLIYTESVDLLYSANTFDFRRTDSVLRLPKVMLPHRLQQLRRIQISTAFACYDREDMPPTMPAEYWKYPDDRQQWPAACEVLASLHQLQYARVTIVISCQPNDHRHPPNPAILYEILQPLKTVEASEFVVEVTELVEMMRERLGKTPFRLLGRDPPNRV